MLAQFQILIVAAILIFVNAAFPPSLRVAHPVFYNKIVDINSTCDSNAFNVTVFMEQPFKGVLFAKSFSQECRSLGVLSNSLTINLPTYGCGVRLNSDPSAENSMYYSVDVMVQQDKHLRQISDQERTVHCVVEDSNFAVNSFKLQELLKKDVNQRKSRMHNSDWPKDPNNKTNEIPPEALTASRAWMEIMPVKDKGNTGVLQVGEPALLMVKSTLPDGIGWRVVDCAAHDGLGDTSQRLLDENGCPLDELLLPALFKRPARPIAMMKHQEAVAQFAAFKFPDRDRLHLSCGLQLCRGSCAKINCSNPNETTTNENRLARTLSNWRDGEILDRIEVFNSVEVKAPGIEFDEDFRKSERYLNSGPFSAPFGKIPGDRAFCVSPGNMALTFCLLGLVFLCAVIVTAWSLLRTRSINTNVPYYTRSLFSSSAESAYGGSKLLLHESPSLGHNTRSLHSYGRIF